LFVEMVPMKDGDVKHLIAAFFSQGDVDATDFAFGKVNVHYLELLLFRFEYLVYLLQSCLEVNEIGGLGGQTHVDVRTPRPEPRRERTHHVDPQLELPRYPIDHPQELLSHRNHLQVNLLLLFGKINYLLR
jgi:hypothetical protein